MVQVETWNQRGSHFVKYLCALNNATITSKECLECSLGNKGISACNFSYPLLKAIFVTQEDRSSEVHVTDLVGCLLKSYLDKKEPKPRNVLDMLRLFIGIAVHQTIANANKDEAELPIKIGKAVGTADYFNGDILIDFKTAMFLSHRRSVKDTEEFQLSAYAAALDFDGPRFIQWIDPYGRIINRKTGDTSRPGVLVGGTNYDYSKEEIIERSQILSKALESHQPPQAEPSWLCEHCDHVCPVGKIYLSGNIE